MSWLTQIIETQKIELAALTLFFVFTFARLDTELCANLKPKKNFKRLAKQAF